MLFLGSIYGSLFLFACGERVWVVSRGVSDTCWLPCVTCVTMGDHPPYPMWESGICGRQHQYMRVSDKWDWLSTAYGQKSGIPAIVAPTVITCSPGIGGIIYTIPHTIYFVVNAWFVYLWVKQETAMNKRVSMLLVLGRGFKTRTWSV